MTLDIALFWMTVAGFLIADNLILAPQRCDVLRLGRAGVPWYEAGARLSIGGREATLLNPLNPFDRGLVTTLCLGDVQPTQWRATRRMLREVMPTLNKLAMVGYAYLLLAGVLAYLSFRQPFFPILIAFGLSHLLAWLVAAALIVPRRRQLHLSGLEVTTALLEALFVPAYLMNMGKRLLYKRQVVIPSLGLALRSAKRSSDPDDREILRHRLRERMDAVAWMHGLECDDALTSGPDTGRADGERTPPQRVKQHHWIRKARACLMA